MKEIKRGYLKWRDEDGKLHKVLPDEEADGETRMVEEMPNADLYESEDNGFV